MSDLSGRVHYDPIVVSAESTIVAEYFSESTEEEAYQSEAALERGFGRSIRRYVCWRTVGTKADRQSLGG